MDDEEQPALRAPEHGEQRVGFGGRREHGGPVHAFERL
jgi:hypothetical protein